MKCPESEQHLQRYLDGTDPFDAPEWQQHLAECPPCSENASTAHVLMDALHRQRAPVPPPGMSQRITETVLADRTRLPRRWRAPRHWLAAAAMAACIAVLMLAQQLWLPKRTIDVHVSSTFRKAEPSRTVEKSIEKATTAVASLGGRFADNTTKQAKLLWSLAPKWDVAAVDNLVPAAKDAETSLEPAAESLRNGTKGVARGMTVVAQTTRRAVNYFLRDLSSLTPPTVKNN